MILGLNAKRIGDILTGAGDKAEAAKAYAEAREYYQKALKEFPDVTTRENQKIQKQIAGIPGK
jgi:predicted negative regulator of RcsB-dependent stress response